MRAADFHRLLYISAPNLPALFSRTHNHTSAMDFNPGKLFLRELLPEITEEQISDYFSRYGRVLRVQVRRDQITARPDGSGYLIFADPSILGRILAVKHTINGSKSRRWRWRLEFSPELRRGSSNDGGGRGTNTRNNMQCTTIALLLANHTGHIYPMWDSRKWKSCGIAIGYMCASHRAALHGLSAEDRAGLIDSLKDKLQSLAGKYSDVTERYLWIRYMKKLESSSQR